MLLAAFAATLVLNELGSWLMVSAIAAAIAFLPKHRRLLLTLGALYRLIFHHTWLNRDFMRAIASTEGQRTDWTLTLATGVALAGIFVGIATFFHYVRTRQLSFVSRRPVLVLVSVYFAMLAAAGILPMHGLARVLVWVFLAVLAPYLWFFAYVLADAASKTPDGFAMQVGCIQPFWMAPFNSGTPIAKGAAYLRKIEAATAKDFSTVQLKGVKLALWVFVLDCLLRCFTVIVHGGNLGLLHGLLNITNAPNLGVPTLEAALQQTAAGVRVPIHLAWACVAAHFAETVLLLYVTGNLAVACCRMAGFNALRNTYRPLQSATIAEFWNRYYYYFKELLVDFFFFPCYRRYFKKYRRLRLFVATLSAASLGNMLYHFSRDYHYVAELGFWRAVSGFHVFAVYTLVLGIGIGISQLRNRRQQTALHAARRVLASVSVIFFFAILETLNSENRVYPLPVHLRFLWNMVYIF